METSSVTVEEGETVTSELEKGQQNVPTFKLWAEMEGAKPPQVVHVGSVGELRTPERIKQEPGEGLQQLWETQWQEFLRAVQSPDYSPKTPEEEEQPSPWGDAEAFLGSFEQVAKACRWPAEQWAVLLLPALGGAAKQAFSSLGLPERGDYGQVKAAILQGEAVARERQRQHFRRLRYQEAEGPRGAYRQLRERCAQWLGVERRSKEQILELLVLEQFLAVLPPEMQNWVRNGSPATCAQAVVLAEEFLLKQSAMKLERELQVLRPSGIVATVNPSETVEVPPSGMWEGLLHKEAKQAKEGVNNPLGEGVIQLTSGPQAEDGGDGPSPRVCPPETCSLGLTASGVPRPPGSRGYVPNAAPLSLVMGQPLLPHSLATGRKEPSFTLPDQGWPTFQHKCSWTVNGCTGDGQVHGNKVEDLCLGGSEHTAPKEETLDRGNIFQSYEEEATRFQTQQGSEEEQGEDPGKSVAETLSYWEGGSQREVTTAQENILQHEGQKTCSDIGESSRWSVDSQTAHITAKSQALPYRKECLTLMANERIPLGEKPYKCPCCGRSFNHNSSLTAHEKIHAGVLEKERCDLQQERPEQMELRDALLRQSEASRYHEEGTRLGSQLGAKPEKSMDGGLHGRGGNVGWEESKGHQRLHHCHCGRSFKHRCNLKAHERTHTGEKPHKCSDCGRSFGKGSTLRAHVRTHTGEKPYMCSTCGKRFTTRSGLLTHERIHTGEKPYKCSDCGRSFIQKSCLLAHEISHKGEKSYTCSDCGKNFGHSSGLRVHRRIHSGGRTVEKL